MAKLPKAREALRVIRKLGFSFSRQRGSHAIYRHPNGKRITVPIHGGSELGPSVFGQILKDAEISAEEFWGMV